MGSRSLHLSFRDAPLGAGPESILPIVVMDSGLALRAPRNDGLFVKH
jgi:error-prone DNA polymerase